ncbi:Rha family transcriptional regulator [Pseudomonas putida]|uniref:Transporter n=1 Tax=Pseudomonas putida TaxID=303 RepID=A0A7V8J5E2_PSEPU|nr:Rha family transcriptional regulator [Pseudomonas putida]KAF0255903.1 transporter [Pseudomonas putida]
MHQTIQSNTVALAPQNANHDFVARMSSREIAEVTQKRHDNVWRTIESLHAKGLIGLPQFEEVPNPGPGPLCIKQYLIGKRDSFVVVAQLSPEFTAALVDRWQQLEAQVSKPMPADLSKLEILQMALESEKARVLLTVQVEAQATKIEHLENLFKEGMTPAQFCKGLNGVNVMQVNAFLKARNWLFTEGSSGTRYRVAAYARDRYMTEHQHEVAPHGKEPFIAFTPVLLRKGAVRLYELYLAGELPMKKNWDGLHTHDKAVRGAA